MKINKKARAGIVAGTATAAALTVVALLGTASANAADSTPAPSSSSSSSSSSTSTPGTAPADRPVEDALTGDTAAKVQAAVEAKYPDATIDRMETDGDGAGAYEAHITKADGTHALVLLDDTFAIVDELTGPMGPGGPGDGGPGGQRSDETPLTGDSAAKVQAAVEAKYPDATIDRMETDADGQGVYEAHLTKADGSHVTVFLDDAFTITGEAEGLGGPGGIGGPGGHGGPGANGGPGGPGANGGQDAAASSTPA